MSRTHTELWQECLAFISENLQSPEQFRIWFQPLTSLDFSAGNLKIDAPSKYFVEQLEERYINLISAAVTKIYGRGTKLFYHFNQVGGDPTTGVTLAPSNESSAVRPKNSSGSPFRTHQVEDIDPRLNPRYTFENYCGSHSNQVARSIAEAIAANPKAKTFNPLFVFGPTGVGKTHLIQAIGIRLKEANPETRVLYVTARLFESQYTTAVGQGKINDFINFYQSIEVLIIDDIQDLAGKKPGTQNAFFHIFNHLHQNQRQLILSSDTRPSLMEGLDARLLSRFKWGMTAELEKPDIELRRDVLTMRAKQDGLEIPREVMEYIAGNVTDSIRELEGVVVSLVAHATVLSREITIDLARNVLANAVKINKRQINFEMIVDAVSTYYNIESDTLFARNRKREISDARQMVMYLARKLAKMPSTTIGTRLLRSHATVLHACRNIEERIPIEKQLREDISKIETSLKG